jgi:hypothetical protein
LWSRWKARRPWAPDALTETAIASLEGEPRTWLDAAVNLMAFGQIEPPADSIECGARRLQASRALCNLAKLKTLNLIGGADGVPIDPKYFDFPRKLGTQENSLELDTYEISDAKFDDQDLARGWSHVRIDPPATFMEWLNGCGPAFHRSSWISLSSPT